MTQSFIQTGKLDAEKIGGWKAERASLLVSGFVLSFVVTVKVLFIPVLENMHGNGFWDAFTVATDGELAGSVEFFAWKGRFRSGDIE